MVVSRVRWVLFLAAALAGCSGATTTGPAGSSSSDPAAPPAATADGPSAPPSVDPTSAPPATPPAPPPFTPSSADGTATRVACTSTFGSALSLDHGRLDGYLVSIVPSGTRQCNGDSSHLHLQVKANGAVYDVAVNLDALEAELDAPLPGAAWSEGWHAADDLDYATSLGLHSTAFAASPATAQRQHLETLLASVNHVAIYATAYDPSGAHLVHRKGGGRDGALVLDPLSSTPHVVAFRFTKDTF